MNKIGIFIHSNFILYYQRLILLLKKKYLKRFPMVSKGHKCLKNLLFITNGYPFY
jgi:hypothetical protein